MAKGSLSAYLTGWPTKRWSLEARTKRLRDLADQVLRWSHLSITQNSTCKGLPAWEKAVKAAAEAAMIAEEKPWDGPVRLVATFYMQRPKKHYGTGINATVLKAFARVAYYLKAPDLDKLIRGIGDPMNGVVYEDDKQTVEILSRKRFAERNGVVVKMIELEPMADVEPDFDAPVQGLLFELDNQSNMDGIVQ